jgi:RNA polymerase sigma factor (TIGR02999 family)
MRDMTDVTSILNQLEQGQTQAAGELFPLVYDELRQMAAAQLVSENPGHTLQPTALVNEAYLRLVGPANAHGFANRRHFFGAASEAMRCIIDDQARNKRRQKRGGVINRVDQLDLLIVDPIEQDYLLDLNEAIDELAREDSVKAELVKLRYFGGLDENEAAECLHISRATASRYWTYARAWLFDRLRTMDSTSSP